MPDQQPQYTADDVDMGWVLTKLTEEPGVVHALLYTTDGLPLVKSEALGQVESERTAAALCGIQSSSDNLIQFCGLADGALPWQYDIKSYGGHTVLMFAAGEGTGLAVSVAAESTSREVAIATEATLRVIRGMRSRLAARDRDAGAPASS